VNTIKVHYTPVWNYHPHIAQLICTNEVWNTDPLPNKLGVVAHACNLATLEVEIGGSWSEASLCDKCET
jgi:hypothetical protein